MNIKCLEDITPQQQTSDIFPNLKYSQKINANTQITPIPIVGNFAKQASEQLYAAVGELWWGKLGF